MGIWDSVRSTVDRVTGNAANLAALEADSEVVKPGQSVNVRIAIKNGLSALEVRAVLLEIEAVETIDLPRYANWASVRPPMPSSMRRSRRSARTGIRSGSTPKSG